MRSEPARLGGISLGFTGIPPKQDENFPYEQRTSQRRWDRVFFNQLCFPFQMLIG